MKFRAFNKTITGLILSASFFINSAYAGIITQTWQATVTSTNSSAYALNDVISWTATYDDTSTIMYQYSDGMDGIAGTTDDTVSHVWALDCPSGDQCADFTMFTDVQYNFNGIFSSLAAHTAALGNGAVDKNNVNSSHAYLATNGYRFTQYYADAEVFTQANADGDFYLSITGLPIYLKFMNAYVSDTQYTEVPVPSTIAILALGLLGLASRRFKK